MDSIIEQLQKTKEYTVTEIGGEGEKVNTITNYRAINSKHNEADVVSEIATADMVCRYIDCFQRRPYTERHCR
jgi:mannitol-1-phosphate 5-dehydrogenase